MWATTADVTELLGETVTDANMAKANTDLAPFLNRGPAASAGMGPRDLYWAKLAACYQAVWRTGQVDVDTRQSVKSFSQDGLSVDYGDSEWKVVLAPMAARSLRNLSWKGTRTDRTPNVSYPTGLGDAAVRGRAIVGFLDESFDEHSDWSPL